jgi:ABC-type phosphate transport system substrate-binding protein
MNEMDRDIRKSRVGANLRVRSRGLRAAAGAALTALILALCACAPGAPAGTGSAASPTDTEATASPSAREDTASAVPAATEAAFEWTSENFPRLDGSTATIPLCEAVMAALLGIPRSAATAQFSGTSRSIMALSQNEADVLLVYRPPEQVMEEYGKQTDYAAVGRDALVFLKNAKNPVQSLTTEQIRGIYTGKITDWSELGGDPGEIIAYQRNETSGSQALMLSLVMGYTKMAPPPANLVATGMEGLVTAVASYDNGERAIGYNVYYYVSRMKDDPNVGLLSVDGVSPTDETIASGEYPFVNDFYVMIHRRSPPDSPARRLYEWMQSAEARELIKSQGYIPSF